MKTPRRQHEFPTLPERKGGQPPVPTRLVKWPTTSHGVISNTVPKPDPLSDIDAVP